MKLPRWWRDTLFKRLFVLMCGALVVSHLVAWFVVTRVWLPLRDANVSPPPAGAAAPHPAKPPLPTLGSLPPTPGLPAGTTAPPPSPSDREPPPAPPRLPASALLIDYGVRLLLIGIAAWWAARWVSKPVQQMVRAAADLGNSVVRGKVAAPLDERRGSVEVREAARVFNRMAERLAQEFRSRGLLMASISHDLRTPLTRMRMRLESLMPATTAQRCVDDIREMNELIDGAIYVFRGETAPDEEAQPTDVYALVQSVADDLVEQGHAVTLQGQPVVAPVRPAALRRAVSNLVGNAIRYGGSAELTVLTLEGVRIFVDDHGPGIPDAQLAQVLQPFLRLDPSRSRETGGAGLGLYIARDLLQQQGAALTLTNRAGGGLRAEIRLAA